MHGRQAAARAEPIHALPDGRDVPSAARRGFSAPLSQRRLRQIAAELLDTLEGSARRLEDEAERLWDVGRADAAASCDEAARLARARAARARERLFG